jgi:preprotein translocase subunit SecD
VAKRTPRPARTLLIFVIAIGVLYGLASLGGTWKPRLGLDLEGGTRITLSAVQQGGAITPAKLKQAASIVDRRVNGSGVSEAQVSTQGNRNIIVEIPGKNASSLVDAVKRTAQLRFRLVAGSPQPGTLAASPSPGASPSTGVSPSPAPSGAGNPSTSPSTSVTPKASKSSASGNPRPAPVLTSPSPAAKHKAKTATLKAQKTPQASTAPTPSVAASPTAAPATTKGASVDDPLAWVQNPGSAWLAKYAAYSCPTTKASGAAPVSDLPDQPLITCDDQGQKFLLSKAVIEGTSLKSASYGTPPQGVGWAVNLTLKGGARTVFGDISQKLYSNGGLFAIVLDGQVISSPNFQGPILDGTAQITGSFKEAEARSLANSLKYGALPLKFESTVETVGPSLAGNQLSAGILAGIIGLLIVMLYCLLYYRGLGLVVVASLIVAALITYGVVLVLAKSAGFTLTLPGIAGLIVAVGITADSFIVYFERIRDEMREGRSMRVAVETGWLRARNTCLAADAVSLLAAVVLYIFAIGVVRGFAFALGISTIIDVMVFFWFTKPVMTLCARIKFFNGGGRLSGLSRETLGVDEPRPTHQMVGGRA